MKKLFLGIGLVSLTLMSLVTYAAKVVTLGTTEWQPYVSNSGGYKGYSYVIVEEAFKAVGYQVKIKFMPWQNAITAAEQGKIDGIFPEYYSPERGQTFEFTNAFSGGPIALYKRRNDAKAQFAVENPTENLVQTFNSMSGAKFGVVKGYTNLPAFDDNLRLRKVAVNDDKSNLEQLYQGKVQYAVIDKYVADYLLNHQLPKNYSEQLAFMPPLLGYKLMYVGITKKNPQHQELVEAFNRGLAIIKKNGQMAQILDHDAKESGTQVG